MLVLLYPPDPPAGYCRQYEWMSSETPTWTLMICGSWLQLEMVNSQFPSLGTPEPGRMVLACVSGTTHDWSALVMLVKVVPCP